MIEVVLNNMLLELSEHKRSRADVMKDCIQKRLDKTLLQYEHELEQGIDYLERHKTDSVIQRAAKTL